MGELLYGILVLPLLTAALTMMQPSSRAAAWVNIAGNAVFGGIVALTVREILHWGVLEQPMLYADALTAVLLCVVGVLAVTASLFSASYMEKELQHGLISLTMLRRYYGLFNVLLFTMAGVLTVENLGLMWVSVEATTLASVFLVAFYFNSSAMEAAWKYVMVCTVGICLALLGTTLLYYAQMAAAGAEGHALSWLTLKELRGGLEPTLVKLAFIFILVGYGTKIGLAPMYTWLPDAHSQAPSPVSALLSGAVLSCAAYALLRNLVIVKGVLNPEFIQYLLIGFGVFSIAVAVPFVLVQHDIKRLLAYSSVEHMGIVVLAVGIGSSAAVYGALLHIINHGVTKATLFYISGIITQEYHTKYLARIRGLMNLMPLTGTLFIVSLLALVGMPPFGVFISKFLIVQAMFAGGWSVLAMLVLLLLAGVFAGMLYYAMAITFGGKPGKEHGTRLEGTALCSLLLSLGLIVGLGVYIPKWLQDMLTAAAEIVGG